MSKVWNGSAWIEREQPKDQDLTDIAALSPANNDVLQRKSGAWVNRTTTQLKTDLSLTKTDVGLANVDNTSDVNKPISTATKAWAKGPFALNGAGTGTMRSTYPPVAVGNDSGYAAFPGVVQLPSGQLRMVWRQGTDHVNTHDGVIKTATSSDLGRTWSAATTLISDGTAPDLRDPSISISPDGTKVYLTYFKSNSSAVASGMFFAVSTDGGASFGTSIRMDSSLNAGAITAPVVDPGNGTLYAVGYAKSGSETNYSTWLFTSTNAGTSWTSSRISNGNTDARDYAEPWLLWQGGNNFMVTQRYASSSLAMLKSTNLGSSWGSLTQIFTGYSGRASTVQLSSGTILIILRSLSGDGSGWFSYTRNAGTSWYPPRKMGISISSGTSQTYACPIEISYGVVYCPVGFEQPYTSNLSRLYGTYITEGAATSPLGDVNLDAKQSIALENDAIFYADDFQRPDGAIAAPWVVAQGGFNIASGSLVSATPDATAEKMYFDTHYADGSIEADFMFNGGSQAGFGIIARYVDLNNHIMVSFETLNGSGTALFPSALNVYRYLSGTLYRWQSGAWSSTLSTATVTVGSAAIPAIFANAWGRIKVEMRGAAIMVYINGVLAVWINDQSDAGTAIGNATKHGIVLNPASTFQQYCRRVILKA